MWALIRKEVLENVRWLPLALLLTGSLTISAVSGGWLSDISPLTTNTMFGSALLSIAFGLLQSIPDERNGARAYLLHRGVTASQVFWAKSFTGFALVFVSVAIPLAACAVWLSMRGNLTNPGRPIQVLPSITVALTAFLFHPTLQLIIYRPARWLGTRVLPMAIPITMVLLAKGAVDAEANARDIWVTVGWTLGALVALLLSAHHAYVHLARQPAANSKCHRHALVAANLLTSAVLAHAGVTTLIYATDRAIRPRHRAGITLCSTKVMTNSGWCVTNSVGTKNWVTMRFSF